MLTSKLIEILTKSLEDNGDMTVVISTGEKAHSIVRIAKGTTTNVFKEKEAVVVLTSEHPKEKK